ncbi:sugar transferase [Campylobacter blaseri]|uniref:UDP-phosphate galactose phosphotransferase n=1 Tax=Campylobacter blaseri TaxID=2042961 RepID=A0A2P8R2F2_9BACT|nr:sugar transferase [Campylobacter blaseri]PSM52661.1 UDP-phosphate galactose phosphotransferase [Campylobacter blaseri]PSM54309.1 UDP-phosphate galactose phosphotransferase [Campylobacter blaseri]QKF85960.1 sugar transferase [Campylobacter blaseri]
MRNFFCSILLIIVDILSIFISISIMTFFKNYQNLLFGIDKQYEYSEYTQFFIIYAITILVLAYNKLYTVRYDFWHETQIIIKSCFLSSLLLFSIMALGKDIEYSRIILIGSYILLILIMPTLKYFFKLFLFNIGIWKKKVYLINGDKETNSGIFSNKYLGYVVTKNDDYDVLFIGNNNKNLEEISAIIEKNALAHKEVIFSPVLQDYDFNRVNILSIFSLNKNLIILKNSLLNPLDRLLKICFDYIIVLCFLPILIIAFFIIFILMRIEEPKSSIFFKQKRLGRNGKEFWCYKFRSMREDGDELLKQYLKEHPEEIEFYKKYHKYKNDPRITKIGGFLRMSSVDELPQLINVLKLEMSIVGPRPILPGEFELGGASKTQKEIILKVRPGLTGLAQINGRNTANFEDRIKMNIWYVKNWSVYKDIVIILKTIAIVLKMKSAG